MNLQNLNHPLFSQADIRWRVDQHLVFDGNEHDGDYIRNPSFKNHVISNATREAAVLIPLVERRDKIHMVLTKRTEMLKSHSGQIAFPGGKIDLEDPSPEHAALREANEEIGLEPNAAEVIGRLPNYFSGSGFKIAPIIAFVDPDAQLVENPEEVEYVFEVPFEFLMNPENHIEGSRIFEGIRRYYLEMPYGDHFIWGVTAGIIRVMYDRLYERDPGAMSL